MCLAIELLIFNNANLTRQTYCFLNHLDFTSILTGLRQRLQDSAHSKHTQLPVFCHNWTLSAALSPRSTLIAHGAVGAAEKISGWKFPRRLFESAGLKSPPSRNCRKLFEILFIKNSLNHTCVKTGNVGGPRQFKRGEKIVISMDYVKV